MKKKAILIFVVFVILLNGTACVLTDSNAPGEQAELTFTDTLIPSSTPTLSPTLTNTPCPTNTPVPTSTNTPTPTLVPTPTLGIPVENDLNPSHVQTMSTEYMGVKLNLELITDSSLGPDITKITVDEALFGQAMARNIFRIWWVKGSPGKSADDIPTEDDFKSFMTLWAKAQETNDSEDWQKVQIDNLYANDLNDGNGYFQKPYSVWFMYSGDDVNDVLAVNIVSVVLARDSKIKNAQYTSGFSNSYLSYGLNLNQYQMLFYLADYPGVWKEWGELEENVWPIISRYICFIGLIANRDNGYGLEYSGGYMGFLIKYYDSMYEFIDLLATGFEFFP